MMVKSQEYAKRSSDAVFRPALTPLEAAMLPAAAAIARAAADATDKKFKFTKDR